MSNRHAARAIPMQSAARSMLLVPDQLAALWSPPRNLHAPSPIRLQQSLLLFHLLNSAGKHTCIFLFLACFLPSVFFSLPFHICHDEVATVMICGEWHVWLHFWPCQIPFMILDSTAVDSHADAVDLASSDFGELQSLLWIWQQQQLTCLNNCM